MSLGLCVTGTLQFVSIFSVDGERPEKEIPLPSGFAAIEQAVGSLPGPNLAFWLGNHCILGSEELGLIWALEWGEHQLKELDVPWPALNFEFIKQNRSKLVACTHRFDQVGIPRDLFPSSLTFYPLDGTDALIRVKLPRRSEHVKKDLEDRVKRSFSIRALAEAPQPEGELWVCKLSTLTHSVKRIDLEPTQVEAIKKAKEPYWLHYDLEPRPLAKFFTPKPQTQPSAGKDGSPKPNSAVPTKNPTVH